MRSKGVLVFAAFLLALPTEAGWHVSVPHDRQYVIGEHPMGALVQMGFQAIQIEQVGFIDLGERGIAVGWLDGWTKDGGWIHLERTLDEGNPIPLALVRLATDENGFLRVGPGLTEPTYPCGMSHTSTCVSDGCPQCKLSCFCENGTGSCTSVTRDFCDGTCASGGYCSQSNSNCGCVWGSPPQPPVAPLHPPDAPKAPTKPKSIEARPVDGGDR